MYLSLISACDCDADRLPFEGEVAPSPSMHALSPARVSCNEGCAAQSSSSCSGLPCSLAHRQLNLEPGRKSSATSTQLLARLALDGLGSGCGCRPAVLARDGAPPPVAHVSLRARALLRKGFRARRRRPSSPATPISPSSLQVPSQVAAAAADPARPRPSAQARSEARRSPFRPIGARPSSRQLVVAVLRSAQSPATSSPRRLPLSTMASPATASGSAPKPRPTLFGPSLDHAAAGLLAGSITTGASRAPPSQLADRQPMRDPLDG